MKKVLFILFGAAFLLASACSNSSTNHPTNEVQVIPVNETQAAKGSDNNRTDSSNTSETNKKLADKLNTIAKDNYNMNNEIAALRARLYLTPDINEVYEMSPALPLENGWYVMDQVPTIRLKGYEKAIQVQFMAGLPGEQFPPVILGVDQDQSDGWSYHGPLIGVGNTVVWTEVRDEKGNTVQTPVIPVVSKMEEDVTAIKAAEKFNDIVEPDKVAAEYYKLTSKGDYQSAWELIHSSERDHPSSGAKNVIRQQFLALQGTKGPALDKILGSNLLDTYKIYVIQILASDVMELKLKLVGGEEKKVHLLKDKENRWRLFWEPERGLE